MSDECIFGHQVHQADGRGGMRGRDERGQWEDCAEVEAPGLGRNCTEHTHHDEPDSAGNVRGYDTQGRPWWCEVGTPTITVAGSDEAEQNAFEYAFPAIHQAVEQSRARVAAAGASESPAPAPVPGLTWTAGGRSQPIRQAVADLARWADKEVFFRQEWLGGWTAGTPARPSWDDWLDALVDVVSTRADCRRRKIGAVIVSPDNRILGVGYNGAPASVPGCLAGACPRGAFDHSQVPPDQPADSRELPPCTAAHAEENAIRAARWPGASQEEFLRFLAGARVVVSEEPCPRCAALLRAVGITSWRTSRLADLSA